jgi:hypothetical protein
VTSHHYHYHFLRLISSLSFAIIGSRCELFDCPLCTLANGNCVDIGVCECIYGWGPHNDCSQPNCNGDCLNGGIHHIGNCTAPLTCTCGDGWGGDNCEISSCVPSCVNGACNTTATALNQCVCNDGWYGDLCDQSGGDVQSLYIISSSGIEVTNPFENYVQRVPFTSVDALIYEAAILAESQVSTPRQLLRAWNGGLLSIAADSLYFVNPYTGSAQILPLGHQVASGAVALALTEVRSTTILLHCSCTHACIL